MILKKGTKALISLAGIITAIASVTVIANWTFIYRLLTYPDDPITNTDWYQPLAPVRGDLKAIPQPTTNSIAEEKLKQIADYAAANNSSALLVLHRGELIFERYWQDFTADSTFNSMSMSKTIVALLVGIAIAEGKIQSELEPAANYITEWQSDRRREITIQDLLYMQSGLHNSDNTDYPLSDLVRMYAGTNADAIALNLPLVEDIGLVFDYNNGNTQILSEILERATGETYAEYLSSRLWQPLGASQANLWLDRPRGNPKPFCCFFATPRDWAKVGQLLLNGGTLDDKQIVDSQWIEKMLQPSPQEAKYGYHIWLKARIQEPGAFDVVASQAFQDKNAFYLDGASRQRVYVVPERELVIVRVGEDPPNWDDSVLVNTLIE